jgi:type I restriction-modification system DNA methylase subunit
VPGICKSASLEEIKGHGYVLTPGRYVGAADVEDDQVPFSGLREIDARTIRIEDVPSTLFTVGIYK